MQLTCCHIHWCTVYKFVLHFNAQNVPNPMWVYMHITLNITVGISQEKMEMRGKNFIALKCSDLTCLPLRTITVGCYQDFANVDLLGGKRNGF